MRQGELERWGRGGGEGGHWAKKSGEKHTQSQREIGGWGWA